MDTTDNAEPVWVLLGKWHGDNQQLLAIAKALGRPFREVPLRFNALSHVPPAFLGINRLSWKTEVPLGPPWPRIVLAAGRRSVPAARWIRQQSGGSTRLVNVNRPWAPLHWFDLIVTTPQYALPQRPNVLCNLMPFLPPPDGKVSESALPATAAALPRPWTVVLVGGNSRPMVLCDATAAALAARVNQEVSQRGGSAWVVDSPRTPESAKAIIARGLSVPSQIVRWQAGKPLYNAMLSAGDRFIVTEDSASMLTEALLTDRPVSLFKLARQHEGWRRASAAWRMAALSQPDSLVGRSFNLLAELGMLSGVRDLGLLHEALETAGMLHGAGEPSRHAFEERTETLSRILQLVDGVQR